MSKDKRQSWFTVDWQTHKMAADGKYKYKQINNNRE